MFDEAARVRPEHRRIAWTISVAAMIIGAGLIVARFAFFPRIGGVAGGAMLGGGIGGAVGGFFILQGSSRVAKGRLVISGGRIVYSQSGRECVSLPASAVAGTNHVRARDMEGIGIILTQGSEAQVVSTPKTSARARRMTSRHLGCDIVFQGFDEDAHRRFAAALKPPA